MTKPADSDQIAKARRWERQESCFECDGDGCPNCEDRRPAQEQPVENSPQSVKCCEVCGETEMLTVMGRNKYACPKHRAASTAEPTER